MDPITGWANSSQRYNKIILHNKLITDISQPPIYVNSYTSLRARTKLPVSDANPPNNAPTMVVKIIKPM